MRSEGMVRAKAEFFSPDGCRYSKSSLIKEILQLPFFRIKVDGTHEYHVHNSRAFNTALSVSKPNERELIDKIRQDYNVDKLKARTSSQLLGDIIDQLQKSPAAKTYTHKDISEMLRQAIAKQSLTSNSERESLIRQLELIEEALRPLEGEIAFAREKSSLTADRSAKTFSAIILLQFALS
mmetsp:Transcript_37544/g.49378  ORF Transcript_37544/g.49378 Transcript_37544/m.49378 type:complete len:181 (+) Transcript_37544:309-851(+)|eukprot:CAMPEP_0185582514 /NCGR_PEP_ID=MMETSP0434-20130131/20851_1 /TAXON_ID=626734 ORGANISM="Favella taraikaensis, Strain Fe Narragansett Bay" /NCGR_SAMPLE_ID=MMETSP0434 /ASSEMBLY_ACC=CAM_ASM_000379 /LENGTH=180 /DNA_ID=CAMNT_0028201343 /DNA_START=308 /DNA_END=850 /DNA_ORIENTATION=+